MVSKRKIEIWVGIFISLGMIALFILAMKVSNLGGITTASGYQVTALFENIGGLRVKAPVTLSGVRIGRVSAIGYNRKRFQAVVTFTISTQYNYLPTDTQASIYTAGLLGEQYIALEPGGDDTVLKNGSRIQLTQSALVLEELIGKFLVNMTSQK